MIHIQHQNSGGQKMPNLSRRTFVVTSVAAGGFALGFRWSSSPAMAAAGDGATLNAFVQVTADNRVSIVVPGSEIGQGVYTTLPKIVAEEMDADWDRVEVRLATADPAYGNPAKDGRQATGGSDATRHRASARLSQMASRIPAYCSLYPLSFE